MKKIDFHIHTIRTISDSPFVFSLDTFRSYVQAARLDAVAITNHNVFDAQQFRTVENALGIIVFPGIEIDVGNGHVLLLTTVSDLDEFDAKAQTLAPLFSKQGDTISIVQLTKIYGDLSKYLVIPHTDKSPAMDADALSHFGKFASAGEVDSPKKFTRALKSPDKLTPVLFSDARMAAGTSKYSSRQTFINCGQITLASLKECFRDKSKVALSEDEGKSLFHPFPQGPKLSTGLNVIIGGRSTGKTVTLDAIYAEYGDTAKYIKQFSLVQQSEEAYEKEFNNSVEKRRSVLIDEHLQGFKRILDEVTNIDLTDNDNALQRYVDTLLKSAREFARRDAFSNAALFDEEEFSIGTTKNLRQLFDSVRHLIENLEFRHIIDKHIDLSSLKRLAVELIEAVRTAELEFQAKTFTNSIVRDVKRELQVQSSAVQVEDVDFYKISMDLKRVERFIQIVNLLKQETTVFAENIQSFRVEAVRKPFSGALDAKSAVKTSAALGPAFAKYSNPYEYLRQLMRIDEIPRSELYKLFVKISCQILNRDGHTVSGGERSEFRLLQEIFEAQKYEILLIDEPESSFDNLFLKSDVNRLIKAVAGTMPVVVVTHNSTVGASIGADFLLYTMKEHNNGKAVYSTYYGYPADVALFSVDGRTIRAYEVVMDSLEGGTGTYEERRISYEAIKN